MKFFEPRRNELELLRKYVSEIRLLDLITRQHHTITFSKSNHTSTLEPIPLYISGSFKVGDFTPSANDESHITGITGLIKEILIEQYERAWISHMLTALTAPISLAYASNEYYRVVAQQLCDAAYARTTIVRLFHETMDGTNTNFLLCLAVHDRFNSNLQLEDFNIEKEYSQAFEIYERFSDEFKDDPSRILVLHSGTAPELFKIAKKTLRTVDTETIVIAALSIGGRLSGYVTFVYESKIELSPDLSVAFANIANHASAAIETFRKLEELHDLRKQQVREYIENLQLDLMQGFRHVARNALFTARGYARLLVPFYAYKGKAEDDPHKKLAHSLDEIDHALNNMASLKLVDERKEVADLTEVFDEACELMHFQLQEAGIHIRKTVKGRLVLPLNRQAMRYAFSNLILNSIQAFEEVTKRADKQIVFTGTRSGREITIDYSDNGPGVRLGIGEIRTYDDIWAPGKSSKKKGTGYGLPMVREVLQGMHNGSINLRPSGRGVTFRINLRTEID